VVFDAAVVGLGAMGSAVVHHLASRGARVVGLDQYQPPHSLGSTHGRSRIIREAYYEHPGYVPLVRRAYQNWEALEHTTNRRLFERTGGLMVGVPGSALVRGTRESAARHGIEIEVLSAADMRRRYRALSPSPEMVGIREDRAGVLFPEACIDACLQVAAERGADIRTGTRVERMVVNSGNVVLTTHGGDVHASRVVLAAGPWVPGVLAALGAKVPLTVERQVMHWLDTPRDDPRFSPAGFPVTLLEHDSGRIFYALPDFGDGVKAAMHYEGATGAIDELPRTVTSSDTRPVLELSQRFVAAAPARIRESAVCFYTNTPDLDFIVDTLPSMTNVTLLSACSGHGFKFASALGEIVAQQVLGQSPAVDISQFSLSRLL
jgi:sarcosine oxidase